MRLHVIALGATALVACVPEYSQSQGQRLLYEHSERLHPCAGTVQYMDGLVPFLEHQLSLEAPGLLRFSWITIPDGWKPLGLPAGAHTAVGAHAWSTEPVDIHELTHAITGTMPARFFTEGVAAAVEDIGDALAPRYVWSEAELTKPRWDPYATIAATDSSQVNYGTAGVFVTYLLVQHGPEPFHEFYRGLGGPVTMPWLRSQFRRAYGLELDDEIATFLQEIPPCEADTHPLNLPECSAPVVPWQSDSLWEHKISMACDDPGVVGGFSPTYAWPSFYPVTIEVPTRGYHVLNVDNSAVTARFGPCFGCPWEPRDEFLDHDAVQRTMLLEPGTYYLRVNSTSDQSPEVTVRLRPL